MLEFKKIIRAHKWRNYAVYELLTLSQLSNSRFYHNARGEAIEEFIFGEYARLGDKPYSTTT